MSTPPEQLPYIDEHAVYIDAGVEQVWATVARFGSGLPKFHVDSSTPEHELLLAGRHWFAIYALTFRLDDLGAGRTRLRAESRSDFPGVKGRAYRALVVGTHFHVLAVRQMLREIKRRAESAARST